MWTNASLIQCGWKLNAFKLYTINGKTQLKCGNIMEKILVEVSKQREHKKKAQ